METLAGDLRYALRTLRARSGFTFVAVVTLALGIGGSTAMFSLVDAVLLGRLPFRDADRLVMVWEDATVAGFPRNNVAPGNFAAFRAQSRVFDGLAAITETGFNLTGRGEPLKLVARGVTAGFFPLLGVTPALGRVFRPDEDTPGSSQVVVLSHGLWQRRFAGEPGIVGQDVLLDGRRYGVIGVMPAGFQFLSGDVEMWVPAALSSDDLANHGAHYLTLVGRLKPGVTVAQADAELDMISQRISRSFPEGARELRAYVLPLREQLVGDVRRPLLVLLLATGTLLLIGCANIAGLLLARAAARRREIGVRMALGAGRGRIVRQLMTESAVLAIIGAVAGTVVAAWSLAFLQRLVPPGVAAFVQPALDASALSCAVVLSVATAILFGLAPALQATRADVSSPLREGGRAGNEGGPRGIRQALVVGQVTLTLVLLVGAGLMAQTLYWMRYADLGLRPERLLTLRTELREDEYGVPARRGAFYEEVLERVRRLPGVASAGYGTSVPLEWKGGTSGFVPEGFAGARPGLSYDANHRQVSTDFLKTLGVPLLRGRSLERTDGAGTAPVALVNETMARLYWPGQDALGRRFKIGDPGSPVPWVTVVGVVGDVRQMGLDAPVKSEMYLPYAQVADQGWFAPRDLVVRASGEPMALVPAIKREIAAVDPGQAVSNVQTFDDLLDEEVASRRLGTTLLAAFATLALLLAAVGIYGMLSHFVAQHTREIGVRAALGATAGDISRLILGRGVRLVLMGVALGTLGGLALTRLVASLLYGVRPIDPATFASAGGLLIALAVLACYLPARRALKIDPATAIRND